MAGLVPAMTTFFRPGGGATASTKERRVTPSPAFPTTAAARLEAVKAEIVRAAALAGRDPAGVTLVAVSKMFPAEAVVPVLEAGHRVFGENRVQEAEAKWLPLRARYP